MMKSIHHYIRVCEDVNILLLRLTRVTPLSGRVQQHAQLNGNW